MMSHLDYHINQCELEVQIIIHLQKLAKLITFINKESNEATHSEF